MRLGQLLAATFAVVSVAMTAATPAYGAATEISSSKPPPALLVEVEPQHRPGYVWVPGFWRWNGVSHVWVKGHFIVARRGHKYVPEHWVETNGKWIFYPGVWAP
jgi:hypothetical protein